MMAMKGVMFSALVAIGAAQDCNDFFAVKCTSAFVKHGCDFAKGAPSNLGWSCSPYFSCALTACDLDQFLAPSTPDEPMSFVGNIVEVPMGDTTLVKTKGVLSQLVVIGKNLVVDMKLYNSIVSVMSRMVPKSTAAKAMVDVAFTKKTVFWVEVKSQSNSIPLDTKSKAAMKFVKDIQTIACRKSGPGCSAYYSKSEKQNEFGAYKFTVEVIQPADPKVEMVDMEAVLKADDFVSQFGDSRFGYDLNIKRHSLATDGVQVAADISITMVDITPEGEKSDITKILMEEIKGYSADAADMYAKALGLDKAELLVFEPTTDLSTEANVVCPASCYAKKKANSSVRQLLFGYTPTCPPECKMAKRIDGKNGAYMNRATKKGQNAEQNARAVADDAKVADLIHVTPPK